MSGTAEVSPSSHQWDEGLYYLVLGVVLWIRILVILAYQATRIMIKRGNLELGKLYVFDTTLRDGEKSLGITLNVNEKMEIARQLVKLGVDVIEAGYPAFSDVDREAVKKIAREIRGAVICGFARAAQSDIDCCVESLRGAEQSRIHTGIAVSPVRMEKIMRLTPDQVVEAAVAAVKYARKYVGDVQFYAEDACRSDPSFLVRVLEKVIEAGATVVNIPDTVGSAEPWEYSNLITYVMNNVRNIDKAVVSIHCHNDLGIATANSLAGIKAGAGQVEGTINGIGERAGNTSLEEVIMAICTRPGSYQVEIGINTREISATSQLVSRTTGVPVPGNKAIVGANAFIYATSPREISLKEKDAYEIFNPEIIGLPKDTFVLNAKSDMYRLRNLLEKMGYNLEPRDFDELYNRFKLLADQKKEVNDTDLQALIEDIGLERSGITVKNISVTTTGALKATATVTLDINGEAVTDAACGNGPVDAVFNVVERMVGERVVLEDYTLRSVGRGRNGLGDATVKVRYGDMGLVVGRGISTDVIEASAKAYANALSKIKTLAGEVRGCAKSI